MFVALLAACAGTPDRPGAAAQVRECFRQAAATEECIDSWNNLLARSDPGLRSAMSAYDSCIEEAGLEEFAPDACPAEADALLGLLP